MRRAADGFTIIEVTIFLGISGLLLLAMFFGTGTMAARQRFTDTTDSLQTFFQSQYDEVVNGVNVRTANKVCDDSSTETAAGQSQCLLLGKLLTIRADSPDILASYIISTKDVSSGISDAAAQLQNAGLKVVADGQTTYEVKWGAVPYQTTRSQGASGTSRDGVNSVAFIRLPNSGQIVQLYYRNTSYGDISATALTAHLNGTESNEGILDTGAYSPAADSTGSSLSVCIKNTNDFVVGSPRSAIVFGSARGAGTITTNYDPGALCNL